GVQTCALPILKNRNWIIIAPLDQSESHHIIIEKSDDKIQFEPGLLSIKTHPEVPDNFKAGSPNLIFVDAAKLVFPLILRKWKQGDYFYPLGMLKKAGDKPGKKKLSKFLIDQKISSIEKESVWVLESKKRIVWVVGKRLDDRFKMTPQTILCTSIQFNKSEKFP